MRNLSFLSGTAAGLRMRHMYNKTVLVGGLLAASVIAPAFANEAEAVGKLMRAGQYGEALGKADAYLAQNPKDAQMRFLKGVILTEQNRAGEAIGIFTKLTEDYPDLPEPYNNLAVLHASSGQYDKARAALDMAIRTNPSYATAYENLGDVHAKLASQAYDKALQLDSGNAAAKSKLTLLRNLALAGSRPAAGGVKVAAATPAANPAEPTQKPVTVAKAEPAKAEAPKAEPAAAPVKAEPVRNDEREDVLKVVRAWARDWSQKDVKGYLSHYSSDFRTPGGQSRAAWADGRRARIVNKERIDVQIESPQVSIEGNTATVKFRQSYTSDQLTSTSRKTLVLVKQGGKWQIRQEQAGS